MNKRGIVISTIFETLTSGGICVKGAPNPIDIRKYLLYWDEIDYPTNNLIHIEGSPDIKFLEECKVLRRSNIRFIGSFLIDGLIFLQTQQRAYEANEKNEKGCWDLAQLSTTPYYVNSVQKQCLEFELFNCLPVPEHDVPLNDILEFKEKRRDELLELRVYLDELYQSIITSEDPSKAINTALTKIELSLNDIDRTLTESAIKKITKSLKGIISDNIDLNGALFCAGAQQYNWAMGLGAFYLIRKLSSTPTIQTNTVKNPMTYIKSIKTQL
jgi:hypothetical protein